MVVFKKKKIVAVKSLGEELKKRRKELNLTLLAIEKKIGIGVNYLKALESNEYDELPGEVYARNFLKKYVGYIGLEWQKIKKEYEEETRRQKLWEADNKTNFGISKKKMLVLPRILKQAGIGVAVFVIVAYIASQVWSLLSPPKLEILYPEENYAASARFIKIMGKVEDEARLTLNDQSISVGDDGYFKVDMDLNSGLNVIKLEAEKRYGRSKTAYRRVIVK